MLKNSQHLASHIIFIVLFIILSVAYFKPAVFDKKELKQHDILEHRGGSKELVDYRAKTEHEALWTNSMFGGMPGYLISTIYPGDVINTFIWNVWSHFPPYTILTLISLISFYILILTFGANPITAAIGAIGFAFSSFTIISIFAGHNSKVIAMGYMPLILAGVMLIIRGKYAIGFVIAAIGTSLNIGAAHYQITYYTFLLIGLILLIDLIYSIREKNTILFFKKTGILAAALIIGLCTSISSLFTTMEYSHYSMRGGSELVTTTANGEISQQNKNGLDKDYAFYWSYGKFEILSLLIPNIQGGASVGSLSKNSELYKAAMDTPYASQAEDIVRRVPLYWGSQPFTAGPTYYGAIICFLFVLGLLIVDKKIKYALGLGVLFSILLAWGKNFDFFNTLVFNYFPGYNKFRAVTMVLAIGQLSMCILAALAIQKIIEQKETKLILKKVFLAAGITGGICLLLYIISYLLRFEGPYDAEQFKDYMWYLDALKKDRAILLRQDAGRSLFFIAAAATLIILFLKNKLNLNVALAGVLVLTTLDLWFIDKRYLNDTHFERRVFENHFAPTAADQIILQDKNLDYRVVNLQGTFGESRTSYLHKSIGGYHGAKLRRYQDIIDYYLDSEIKNTKEALRTTTLHQLYTPILNMLHTKYFIFNDSSTGVVKNEQANGNAWFISKLITVKSANEEIDNLKNINTKTTALIDITKFKPKSLANENTLDFKKDSSVSIITLTNYEPNHLVYHTENPNDGLAVFSEIYYPKGWKATIDGVESPIIRVNYILRALEIPKGNHTIEFIFDPASYHIGNTIARISSWLLIVTSLGISIFIFYQKRKNTSS